jgi:hypothetical protein
MEASISTDDGQSITSDIRDLQEGFQNQIIHEKHATQRRKDFVQTITPNRNTYLYEPLDSDHHIRILRIQRGNPDDELQCMLFPSALPSWNGTPSPSKNEIYGYCALSYCWGEANELSNNKITIYYDTGARGPVLEFTSFNIHGTFWIRDNLKNALLRFRTREKDVNVWVDAICIDQNNLAEKMAQVLRMHEVFAKAESVCIWLGEGGGRERN